MFSLASQLYFFCVVLAVNPIYSASSIGKLDIVWRTNLGEPGRLQTSQLPRKIPNFTDIKLNIVRISSPIFLERNFVVDCEIVNMTDKKMSLTLCAIRSKMTNVLSCGNSGQFLGDFPPDSPKKTIQIHLFPISPGLQKIPGIRFVDLISGKIYDIDNLVDIFVEKGQKIEL
eukprot:Sdes_comp19490_c0_seq1m10991